MHAGSYLRIVRRWWWVIVLLVVSTVGTLLALTFFAEAQYEATVTLQVSAPPPQETPLYSSFGRQGLREEIAQTQTSFSELVLEGDIPYRVLDVLPDVGMSGGELRGRITIDIPEGSQLMRVSVRAPDADTAALLANGVVETGMSEYSKLQANPTANTRKFIEQQLEMAKQELEAAEAELTEFQIANRVGSLSSAINSQYDLMRTLHLQRDLAQIDGDAERAQAIEQTLVERESELQNLIGLSNKYTELVGNTDRARAMYDFLVDKQVEAKIKENQILESSYIQVITPARPPRQPVVAIGSTLFAVAGVGSILAGVLLAFLLEYLAVTGVFHPLSRGGEETEESLPTQRETEQDTG
jgi:uncharacterized protein involved in exopolysaccharide biosynthesis